MKAAVLPFKVVHRGSGAEQLTPALRALLTEAANQRPYSLSLGMYLLLCKDVEPTDALIETYFTPTQRRLFRRQNSAAAASMRRDIAKSRRANDGNEAA